MREQEQAKSAPAGKYLGVNQQTGETVRGTDPPRVQDLRSRPAFSGPAGMTVRMSLSAQFERRRSADLECLTRLLSFWRLQPPMKSAQRPMRRSYASDMRLESPGSRSVGPLVSNWTRVRPSA